MSIIKYHEKVISKEQLTRGFKRAGNFQIQLDNVYISGVVHGCCGFVTDTDNQVTVYVCTDVNHGTTNICLVRIAKEVGDFSGGINNFTEMKICAVVKGAKEIIEGAVKSRKRGSLTVSTATDTPQAT